MSRVKAVVGFVSLAALVSLTFFLIVRPTGSLSDADPPRAGSLSMHGYANDGSLLWSSHAATGELINGEGTMLDVMMSFLPGQSGSLSALGNRLTYGARGGRLEGDISITRDDGLRLNTETLLWDEEDESIECEPIHVLHSGSDLRAGVFRYDLGMEIGRFSGGVKLITQDSPRLTAISEQATLQAETFILENNVRIEADGDLYTCETLTVESDGKIVVLAGDVAAELAHGRIEAETMRRQADGRLIASGDVRLQLEWKRGEEIDGP